MIAALLLAAATPQTAVEAEHAFAADAQALGQWTAFRKWAADDAIFLPPQPVRDALMDAPDPPKSVHWWPTASYISCDGVTAANTGGALWPGGRSSYFSTIWQRQADGNWRYTLDHGDDLKSARARTKPLVRKAACTGKPSDPPELAFRQAPAAVGKGRSPDGTLGYFWWVDHAGGHTLKVWLWNGGAWDEVLSDSVAPPPKRAKP